MILKLFETTSKLYNFEACMDSFCEKNIRCFYVLRYDNVEVLDASSFVNVKVPGFQGPPSHGQNGPGLQALSQDLLQEIHTFRP